MKLSPVAPRPLFCQPCRVPVGADDAAEQHVQQLAHLENDSAWRSWLDVGQAAARIVAPICAPQWKPSASETGVA